MISNAVNTVVAGLIRNLPQSRRIAAFCESRAGAGNNYWRVNILKPDGPETRSTVLWDHDFDFPVFISASEHDATIALKTKIVEKLNCAADDVVLIQLNNEVG